MKEFAKQVFWRVVILFIAVNVVMFIVYKDSSGFLTTIGFRERFADVLVWIGGLLSEALSWSVRILKG